MAAQEVVPQRGGNGPAVGAFADGGDQGGLVVAVRVEDQGFLAGEVLEERRGGDIGGFGDVLDADLVIAAFEEQSQCRVGQRLAGGGLLALAAAGGGVVSLTASPYPLVARVEKLTRCTFSIGVLFWVSRERRPDPDRVPESPPW